MPTIVDEKGTAQAASSIAAASKLDLDSSAHSADDDEMAVTATENNCGSPRSFYYAVRVGYAIGLEEDEAVDGENSNKDGHTYQERKRKHDESKEYYNEENSDIAAKRTPMVKLRSAIFLYWDDVRQFVDNMICLSDDHKAEYAGFNSFEEAEQYLLETEREIAMDLAIAAEMSCAAIDKIEESKEGGAETGDEKDNAMDVNISAETKAGNDAIGKNNESKEGGPEEYGNEATTSSSSHETVEVNAMDVNISAETKAGNDAIGKNNKSKEGGPEEYGNEATTSSSSHETVQVNAMDGNLSAEAKAGNDAIGKNNKSKEGGAEEYGNEATTSSSSHETVQVNAMEVDVAAETNAGNGAVDKDNKSNAGGADIVGKDPKTSSTSVKSAKVNGAFSSAQKQSVPNQPAGEISDPFGGVGAVAPLNLLGSDPFSSWCRSFLDQGGTNYDYMEPYRQGLMSIQNISLSKELLKGGADTVGKDPKTSSTSVKSAKINGAFSSAQKQSVPNQPEGEISVAPLNLLGSDPFSSWCRSFLDQSGTNYDFMEPYRQGLTSIQNISLSQELLNTNIPATSATPITLHTETRQPANDNRNTNERSIENSDSTEEMCTASNSKKQKFANPSNSTEEKKATASKLKNQKDAKRRWEKMYIKLVEYRESTDGPIDTSKILDNDLLRWCRTQYNQSENLSTEKIEKLTKIDFQLAPSWDQLFERLAAHKADTGTLDVKKDDDEELFNWIKKQKKMLAGHFKGKSLGLSGEQVKKLCTLGYEQGQPGKAGVVDTAADETKWNSMLQSLLEYKEAHGKFPATTDKSSLPEHERKMGRWVGAQRKEYKKLQQGDKSRLTAQRLQRLTAIGLDLTPRPEKIPWKERMESLRTYVEENGHCKPPKGHPLAPFVSNMRTFYRELQEGKPSCLNEERVNDLKELGFVFKAGKTPNVRSTVRKTWHERFQELLAYKEEHGHMVVPALSGPLGTWVKEQRTQYRRMKAGHQSVMTTEKALQLSEAGFHFDALRFKGRNRKLP